MGWGGGHWEARRRINPGWESRANDGNRYQGIKLKTEQASHYHAMVPKSHGVVPKSCTKNLPATPIVRAPKKRVQVPL